jgi:hypothetical protein
MVRLLADQMDRAFESDSFLQSSMRLQFADELDLLASSLRAH